MDKTPVVSSLVCVFVVTLEGKNKQGQLYSCSIIEASYWSNKSHELTPEAVWHESHGVKGSEVKSWSYYCHEKHTYPGTKYYRLLVCQMI